LTLDPRFHIEAAERALNNILHGLSKPIVTVEQAGVGLQLSLLSNMHS
jgi:hypothetical protein